MRNDTVNNPPVTLHWENLNVTTQVKRSFGCFPLKKKNSDVKDILQNSKLLRQKMIFVLFY